MRLLLLLLMFSLSSFPLAAAECPAGCVCYNTTVRCSFSQELDRIPDRISPNTTFLDLSFNNIKDIEQKSLTYLTELNTLYLNHNNISDLKNGAFSNLTKLRKLFLYKNNIENIETRVFNNLTSLEIIFLQFNKIHKLDVEMFKGLTKLDILFLYNNTIRKIPPGTFDSLTSLRRLRLDHNPFMCDCDILWLVKMLNKTNSKYETCHFPVEMSGKRLMEITENDVHCSFPDVIVEPEYKTVSVGEQLRLSCKAVGEKEPFIRWTKDDINIELGQRVQVFQNNTLIISKVERTDGGHYKCVASNYLGQNSSGAVVTINDLVNTSVYPEFVVTNQSSKPRFKRLLVEQDVSPPSVDLANTLLNLTLAKGQRKELRKGMIVYYLTKGGPGLVVVVENINVIRWIHVKCDCNGSYNVFSTRKSLITFDSVPPLHRQVIVVLNQLDSRRGYTIAYKLTHRSADQPGLYDWGPPGYSHFPKLHESVEELHSPRRII